MSNLFKGERIRLTVMKEADASVLSRWSEDAEYLRNLDTDYARPRDEEFYRDQIKSFAADPNVIELAIRTIAEDILIGFVSLHSIEWNNRTANLAIGIGESDFRGKGFGTEALKLMLNYAFIELNLSRVGLDVISNNGGAISCYSKCGFVTEGTIRAAVLRDGKKYDRIYMGILKEEWEFSNTPQYTLA